MARAFRGAGLAGDFDREFAEDVVRGAARPCARLVQPFHDRRAVFGVDLDVARAGRVDFLEHPAGGVLDFLADVRGDDRAAVAERRVGDRHLQRVGLQVALAGRQLDVVARPTRAVLSVRLRREFVAPLLGRQQAFVAPGRSIPVARRSRVCAPTAAGSPCPTSAGRACRSRRRRTLRARETRLTGPLAASPEFSNFCAADVDVAGVVDHRPGVMYAVFERRQRGDDLVGRAGRVEAGDRPVEERRRVLRGRGVDLGSGSSVW